MEKKLSEESEPCSGKKSEAELGKKLEAELEPWSEKKSEEEWGPKESEALRC